MMTLPNFLSQCTNYLQQELPPQFRMWLVSLTADDANEQWNIYAPNDFTLRGVRTNVAPKIEQFKLEHYPDTPPLVFKEGKGELAVFTPPKIDLEQTVAVSVSAPEIISTTTPSSNENINNNNGLNSEFTFDTFVVGDENKLAHAVSEAIAKKPGHQQYNPFFLYGSPGIGKTHLIHAIGNYLVAHSNEIKIRYIHAERYMTEFANAIKNNDMIRFRRDYQSLDLLIMDDVQFIAGKPKMMEELFYIFNDFVNNGKQMVFTSDRQPNEVEHLDDRLKSRFASGMPVPIEMPNLETRTAILLKKASLRGFALPAETAMFIADNIHSSVRDLEGALNRLMADCSFSGKLPNIETAQNTLKDILSSGRRQISVEEIQKAVATFYRIPIKDLLGKNRQRSLIVARHTAISLVKELTTLSLKDIGNAFDGRDHTTVLNACKNVQNLLNKDDLFAQDYQNLRKQLQN